MKHAPASALLWICLTILAAGCSPVDPPAAEFSGITRTAAEILGDPHFQAISYGGYRETTRDIQPMIPISRCT